VLRPPRVRIYVEIQDSLGPAESSPAVMRWGTNEDMKDDRSGNRYECIEPTSGSDTDQGTMHMQGLDLPEFLRCDNLS